MNWEERFNGLGFHDQVATDDEINSVTAIQQNIL